MKDLEKVFEDLKGQHSLNVINIFPEVSKLLDSEVLDGFIYVVKQTCLKFDDGRFYATRFFGKKVKTKEKGIKELANILNAKSKEYKFLGTLAPAIAYQVYGGEYIVLSYVLMNEKDCAKFDKNEK